MQKEMGLVIKHSTLEIRNAYAPAWRVTRARFTLATEMTLIRNTQKFLMRTEQNLNSQGPKTQRPARTLRHVVLQR